MSGAAFAQGGWDPADSDADGLPDAFETTYFQSLAQTATGDPDGDTVSNSLELSSGRNPTLVETTPGAPDWQGVPGALRLERWDGISGMGLANLFVSPAFPQSASLKSFVTSAQITPNQAENYGLRLRGWITAPATGTYTFRIAGDDQSQLYLGTNASRFSKRLICRADNWTNPGVYTSQASQTSAPITLTAGQSYYIEALLKEGGGGDHLSIAWTRPGETSVETIPGRMTDGTVVLTSEIPDAADADDDGNEDVWEMANGLSASSAGDHAFFDSDGDGFNNLLEYQSSGSPLAAGGNTGYCEWQTFNIGANNNKLASLTSNSLFARNLAAWGGWFSQPESDQNAGNNFGRRLRCVVTIPTTGAYNFYIAGDDSCALWLNPNGASRFGKLQAAVSNNATSWRNFTAKTTQKSRTFNLTAGSKVYLEALYVEGLGADHCSVAWTGPGVTTPTVIPSTAISTCGMETITVNGTLQNNDSDNDSIPDNWEQGMGLLVTNAETTALTNGEYGDPDNDGLTNFMEYQNNTNPLTANGVPGKWTHELYAEIGGGRVADLIGFSGILRGADLTRLSESTDYFRDSADNYGQRFRATVTPTVSGAYTFWISGDDGAELWLSPNDRKFSKRRIALIDDVNSAYSYSGYNNWEKVPGQKSTPVNLVAGQSYYLEVLHKESAGNDHVSVAWSLGSGLSEGAYLPITGATAAVVAAGQSLASVSGVTGAMKGAWIPTQTATSLYHFVNDGTVASFQLQFFDGSYTKVAKVELRQNGPDITAWQVYGRYKSGNCLGQNFDNNSASSVPVGSAGYGVNSLVLSSGSNVIAASGVVIPAAALTSFVRDADDADDDCLVDAWENQYLSAGASADNGLTNANLGEYGDPDKDSIVNREEWLLGTRPDLADTDEDGYPDGQEVFFMGTNPLVPELTASPQGVVGPVSITAIAAASATWVPTADGGVLSMETRGWIDYQVTVETAGYYVFEIRGRARGSSILSREDFPLDVYVDSRKAASTILTSLNGQQGLAAGFAGWLTPGDHTIRIWNRNLLGRRALQLDALRLVMPSGSPDADSGTMPAWLYDLLAARNTLTTDGGFSYTSPCCIEGTSRESESTTVSVNGSSFVPVSRSVNKRWFANVALSAGAINTVTVTFENGCLEDPRTIEWKPFNITANSHLIIRKDDALRLTAFTPGAEPDGTVVTLTLDGQPLATTTQNAPFIHAFATPGVHTLTATYLENGVSRTDSTELQVLAADFGPAFPVYLNRSRVWSLPNVPGNLPVENDSTLLLAPQAAATGRAYVVDATALGANTIVSRTASSGPVLASGTVTGTLLSHSSNYELPVIYTYPNGDRIVELSVMASSLPPGGYIRLEIWLGGRLFIVNGTTSTSINLSESDFDENGMARVQMLLSSGIGTTCHRTYLHAADGTLIGQM